VPVADAQILCDRSPGNVLCTQRADLIGIGIHLRPADSAAALPGSVHAGRYPLFDQLALNLSHRADDVYPEAAGRRTEIEVVPE
jgi:hypothetical protein